MMEELRSNLRKLIQTERAELKARRDAEIIKLSQKGWSNVKIGKRMGISESSVRRALK